VATLDPVVMSLGLFSSFKHLGKLVSKWAHNRLKSLVKFEARSSTGLMENSALSRPNGLDGCLIVRVEGKFIFLLSNINFNIFRI